MLVSIDTYNLDSSADNKQIEIPQAIVAALAFNHERSLTKLAVEIRQTSAPSMASLKVVRSVHHSESRRHSRAVNHDHRGNL